MSFFEPQFWPALLQIIGVNIILSGDNAVVIALACRALPPKQQKIGVMLGAGAAVVLRIIFTVFIVWLLSIPYLKVTGGLLLFWIGYKLMLPQDAADEMEAASGLWHAVKIVVIADAVMSLDNVIAVAAAAKGDYLLLVLGLVTSIPLVVYGATLLMKLIGRFPVIVTAGAALIGYIGGEVVITDPAFEAWVAAHAEWLHDVAPLVGAIAVVLVGRIVAPAPLPAAGLVAEEALGAAVLAGGRLALQIIGRVLVARAPMIVAFVLSLFGYSMGQEATGAAEPVDVSLAVLHGVRPIFAAAIAVVIGEVVSWLTRRSRGGPLTEGRES
jgi:YjbE family integral membrane protein